MLGPMKLHPPTDRRAGLPRVRAVSVAAALAALLALPCGAAPITARAQAVRAPAPQVPTAPASPAQGTLEAIDWGSAHPGPPEVLYEVERVVDGDTVYVLRDGERVKLRLLSVDTEEKLSDNPNPSPSKPETVFGQDTMLWARELIESTAEPGAPARVGLRFPNGVEQNDVYGRLLCHVVLADGRDFNLLLVELGKSPYFNKYGNSLICHEAFVAAQRKARANRLGIWNPTTNAAATPGAPEARRPYDRLIPWWNARAEAVASFRALAASGGGDYVDAQVPEQLSAAVEHGRPVAAFGTLYELFDETNGDWTLLFRASGGEQALRVVVPPELRDHYRGLGIERVREEYRQNYLWARGVVSTNARGYVIRVTGPGQIEVAEPRWAEARGTGDQ